MSLFDDIQPVVDVTVDTFTTSKLRCFTKCADNDTNCMSVFYRYGPVITSRIYLFIRLGLNVALTHQNRSYRDIETKGNVEE